MHPKSHQHHVWYFRHPFSVRTSVVCERFLVFLIVAGLGSVEVSWAGENRGSIHSKCFKARLMRFWVCFFFSSRCDLHSRSIFGLGRDGSMDIIPLSLPSMPFFCYDRIWAYLFTLFLCEKNDMRPDFMLECAGQERESVNTAQNIFW